MKNNSIIYINGRFLTQRLSGVQRYAMEVVKQLDQLCEKDEFVILVPQKSSIQKLDLRNINIVEIGKFTGHLWEQVSLPLYILRKNRKAKLLNLCNIAPILKPSYVVIHDIAFKTHPEHLDKKFALWYRIITKFNIKRYKHIFTVSNFSKEEILNSYKINPNKVSVTYNSAEHLKNIDEDQEIIKKFNLDGKDFYFSLGSRSPHKNHKYIVECAKANPDITFVISGDYNTNIFSTNNKDEQMLNNTIYTGFLNDKEMVALYKNCKGFIFPSLYEGFGIPPLEAITLGCNIIILSDIPVFHEVYKDYVMYIDVTKDEYKWFDKVKSITENDRNRLLKSYTWNNTSKIILDTIRS